MAHAAWMTAIPLLGRIRSVCEGPVLLIKGPEVVALYPDRARGFNDIDLLVPDPEATHATLRANGFVEVDDPETYEQDQHHLRPLQWPALWPWIEIHKRPLWPALLPAPGIEEIVARAVPSATGVQGLSAPHPAHHALILASHHWVTEPMGSLRDLVDVFAVTTQTDERELAAFARELGIERIWHTTYAAIQGLFGGERQSWAVRLWGRHLPEVRERTVVENHVERWLHGFWGFSPRLALRRIRAELRQELVPYPGERWRDKLIRVAYALTHPRAPVSSHQRAWREAAARSEASGGSLRRGGPPARTEHGGP
jgi:hypothetical protein